MVRAEQGVVWRLVSATDNQLEEQYDFWSVLAAREFCAKANQLMNVAAQILDTHVFVYEDGLELKDQLHDLATECASSHRDIVPACYYSAMVL